MWKLAEVEDGGRAARTAQRAGASTGTVLLVGGTASLRDAVAAVVVGAGNVLVEGGETAATTLWWAGLAAAPPPGAVLVDDDAPRLWSAAARAPGHRAVVLPEGRAWLGEHLAERSSGAASGPGRLIVVGGVGEAHHCSVIARELGRCAERSGVTVVLIDATPQGLWSGLAEADGPAASWDEAADWVEDGSPQALLEVLPLWRGVPVLSWPTREPLEGRSALGGLPSGPPSGIGGEPGAPCRGDGGPSPSAPARHEATEIRARVIEALGRGVHVVIVCVGELPRTGLGLVPDADELVVCVGADVHEGVEPAGVRAMVRGEGWAGRRSPATLVTVQAGARPPDGPQLAEAWDGIWAGTVVVRPGQGLARAGERLLRRHWVPRLHRGVGLGAAR